MKKENKAFTLTLDYQPEKSVSVSFSNGEKMIVKTFEIKKKLNVRQIKKLVKSVANDLDKHVKQELVEDVNI